MVINFIVYFRDVLNKNIFVGISNNKFLVFKKKSYKLRIC